MYLLCLKAAFPFSPVGKLAHADIARDGGFNPSGNMEEGMHGVDEEEKSVSVVYVAKLKRGSNKWQAAELPKILIWNLTQHEAVMNLEHRLRNKQSRYIGSFHIGSPLSQLHRTVPLLR